MPKGSAKTTALAVSAVTLCVLIITVSVIGGIRTPVKAADIYIGTDAATESEAYSGVGRYSDIEEVTGAVTEETSSTEEGTPVPDAAKPAEGEKGKRYTVTFAFHSRDSISCSAEEAATVEELASRLGITFSDMDVLNVPADTLICEDTVITTDKVTYATVSVRTAIPYDTKYVDDSSIYSGNTRISQYGQNGETVTEYEVKYVNGVEESRTELSTYVSKKPVQQVVRRGTAVYTPPAPPASSNNAPTVTVTSGQSGTITGSDGKTYRYSGYIDVQATMYYSGGYCANGMPADERVIAVDPSVIPLGTKVYVSGDYADIGVRTAADTGGSIKGNIIDICFNRGNPLASGFGFRPMRVYILE